MPWKFLKCSLEQEFSLPVVSMNLRKVTAFDLLLKKNE